MRLLSLLPLSLLLVPALAHAQPEPAPAPAPAPPEPAPAAPAAETPPPRPHLLSATFSPIHLLAPIAEVSLEPSIVPHLTAAVIGGYGSIKVEGLGTSFRFRVLELGGQVRGYLDARNEGLHAGVEALYVRVDTDDQNVGSIKVSGVGEGLAVGPLVGYKLVTRVGFTFDPQLGVQFAVARADAKASDGTQQAQGSSTDSKAFLLLNLNVGWTF